ncbi:hypothetical protein [Nocardia yamanashiensis]|uniref:WXG100-like domain-containing protein n=1 Tax=Nocardia yamanashiensis TaxID=209247 RepID=UPI000832A1C8|nr:hypothetical protein [Nocardia yamanashiensis]
MALDVDPKGYYQAATNCFDAAEALRDSFLYIFRELSGCGAMAGVDEDGKAWATSYDTAAYQMVSFFAEVHSTLNAYGTALNDLGFNHAQADSALQGTPQPQRPADRGTPVFGPYSVPASAGGTGKGIIDESIGLLSEIGVPVPDGDTDKLLKAADAWDRLGTTYQNTNAKDKITIAAGLFDNMTAPDAIQAGQDLKSLESAIAQLLNSCKDIAKSCTDYRDALNELRDEIKGFLSDLAKELAIDAAITIVAAAVSFGAGAITAIKSLETLRKWAGKIKDAVRLWKARKVSQIKGLTEGARAGLANARQAVRDLLVRLRGKLPSSMPARPGLFSRIGNRTNREVLDSGDHLPMTRETIQQYADELGVDLEGIEINIASSPEDVRYYDYQQASASTQSGSINFAPATFADEESLVRNIIHERVHIDQYREGRVVGSGVTKALEDEAYAADQAFWEKYLARKGGR